jgi:hypothetical protein
LCMVHQSSEGEGDGPGQAVQQKHSGKCIEWCKV